MRLTLSIFLVGLSITVMAQPPAGYYNAATGSCSALKTALKTIITNGHSVQTYADLWTQYPLSDTIKNPLGSGYVIRDMYSLKSTGTANYYFTPVTNQCGNYTGEGICYNREHSFPSSWFNDASPMVSDYNHIFPTDGYVNNARSNYRYGEVATANYTSTNGSKRGSSSVAGITGTVFEPIDRFKGDVARAYLYMVTRYQDNISTFSGYSTDGALTLSGNTFPSVEINYLKLMIKWHNLDPVDAKEIQRNNGAYSFQGNRNPYIDHPEYVAAVWNASCPGLAALPVDIVFFTGKLEANKIALKWEVENEISFQQYEVERSFNGTVYNKIGIVKASGSFRYGYNDDADNIRGRRVYYRLKKVDKDGKYAYSEVFTIHIPLNTKFVVYPNPARDYINLQVNGLAVGNAQIIVTDMTGKVLISKTYSIQNNTVNISTQNLTTGTYLVKMKMNEEAFTQKVMVIK